MRSQAVRAPRAVTWAPLDTPIARPHSGRNACREGARGEKGVAGAPPLSLTLLDTH